MCKPSQDAPIDRAGTKQLKKLKGLAKALHCPARWDIVEIIGSGTATTDTIRTEMDSRGYDFTRSGLYYHLSELTEAGVIDVADYVENGRGAPTKEWELRRKTIEIDLVHSEE